MGFRQLWQKARAIAESKRGSMGLDQVPGVAIAFVVIATIFVVGYLVLAGLSSSTTNTAALGAVGNLTSGLNNVITFAPTWGTVIGAAVILAIVVGGLYFFMRRRQ